jgi:hypothetical protein
MEVKPVSQNKAGKAKVVSTRKAHFRFNPSNVGSGSWGDVLVQLVWPGALTRHVFAAYRFFASASASQPRRSFSPGMLDM